MYQEDWEKLLEEDSPAADPWMDQEDLEALQLEQIRQLIGEPSQDAEIPDEFFALSGFGEDPAQEAADEVTEAPQSDPMTDDDQFTRSLYALLDGGEPEYRDNPGEQPPDIDDLTPRRKAHQGEKPSRQPKPRTQAEGSVQTSGQGARAPRPAKPPRQKKEKKSGQAVPEQPKSGYGLTVLLVFLLLLEIVGMGAEAICWIQVLMK